MAPFTIEVREELVIDYLLDTGLVVDGRREWHKCSLSTDPFCVTDGIRPSLAIGTRIYIDADGALHLVGPLTEPVFESRPGTLVVRRMRREIVIAGALQPVWELLRVMDGACTITELQARLAHQLDIKTLLPMFIAANVVDVTGRPAGRFIHTATKKGVLPGGGLSILETLKMVTDGNYRVYPEKQRVPLQAHVPPKLQPFDALINRRRSYRGYNGRSMTRLDFDALLRTGCGITGELEWAGRETKLRAYPSSGGLYSVEVYPVVFAVDDLESGIYHYRPTEHLLESLQLGIGRGPFLSAALPEEREMVSGIAVMICLTGVFSRHERKYGEGGYRMMVAEAGHISENLILTATALEVDARPFGGVFDDILNKLLGLDSTDEQFLLSVIVGYAGS
jgi:SagB-type dehydrogenase family enzyme